MSSTGRHKILEWSVCKKMMRSYSLKRQWVFKHKYADFEVTTDIRSTVNGLQVNRGGVFDRVFTESLIIRDFDDTLKNPYRYVNLFLLHTLL